MDRMEANLLTAKLTGTRLLAAPSQTYLLTFTMEEEELHYLPGQFLFVVMDGLYPEGHPKAGQHRQETRAYSMADIPRGAQFQLCLNCAGHISQHLCSLALGETIRFHGPFGDFTRRMASGPIQPPALYFGADSGIVPIRSIFRSGVPANSTLIQTAATREDLLFRDEFGAAIGPRYLPFVTPGFDFLERQIRRLLARHPEIQQAYLCGLKEQILPVRDLLLSLGWERHQVIYERYN